MEFSYEWIEKNVNIVMERGGHFRIKDSKDNAICFCYLKSHAELVVDALNECYTAKQE